MVAKAPKSTTETVRSAPERRFRVELGDDGRLPLPTEIVDALSLEPGTIMEVTTNNGHIEVQPVALEDSLRPMPPPLPIEGILKDYFHGWDDIQQFIAEERATWEREWDTLPEDSSKTR